MLFPTFLTLLLPTLSLSQSATANHESEVLVIPEGTGPYSTSYSEHELIDDSRLDPFNSSHVRRIMVTRFDPVPKEKCKRTLIPYCSRVVCATEGQILEPYDWPADLWSKFRLQVCEDKKKTGKRNGYRGGNKSLGSRGKFPIALYSAGLNTTRQFSNSLVQEIASHGFTVVSVDHPYDTDVVDFPNGDVIYGNRVIKPVNANGSTASVEHALEVRAQDASFVLDVLGFTKHDHDALFFGHSMGGAAAGTALLNDLRFRAGVNFDGMMFGRVLSTPFGTPSLPQAFLFFGMEGHNSSSDPSWGELWDTLEENPNADYYKMFNLINGTHGSWWDLNILVDVAGLRDELTETAQLLISPLLDGAYVWKVMGRYVPSFFWYVLGMKPEDEVLKGPSEEFPGVVLVE